MKDFSKYLAEFLGTFFLGLIVALSVVGNYPVATPVLAGFTLLVFVYTIGRISGSNINPAVSIGLQTRGVEHLKHTIIYILSQVVAAFVVINVLHYLKVEINASEIYGKNVFLAETLGTLLFGFGIMSVVRKKVDDDMAGIVIGGSLFLGITVAALIGSAGALNPAVALVLGLTTWEYMLAPIFGMFLGMGLYDFLIQEKVVHPEVAKEVKKQLQNK